MSKNTICHLHKYIWPFTQIHFTILTNTLDRVRVFEEKIQESEGFDMMSKKATKNNGIMWKRLKCFALPGYFLKTIGTLLGT